MYKFSLIACLFFTFPVAAESKFKGLDQLVDSCWQASFPDGKKVDTHCFSEVYSGAFIKDQHIVCGENQPYRGETWYVYDEKDQSVSYRYYNSMGGVSDGTVEFKDQKLLFPDETYEKDGAKIVYRTDWSLQKGMYQSNMWQKDKSVETGWKKIWQMDFKQVDLKQNEHAFWGDNGLLNCQSSES
jgi:hypothetical protein